MHNLKEPEVLENGEFRRVGVYYNLGVVVEDVNNTVWFQIGEDFVHHSK